MTFDSIHTCLSDFTKLSHLRRRLLGIDFGDKRLGISICDPGWVLASPLEVITKNPIQRVQSLCDEYDICGIVLGNPLHMNGSASLQSDKVQKFSKVLWEKMHIPIILWDERCSTSEVLELFGYSRKQHSVDKFAACVILQNFLEVIRILKNNPSTNYIKAT